jgi:hypothetical protein
MAKETYAAEILADSISPDGVRLTSMWVTFPRFILAEVNTHRMLSRNSNSSRAIPPEMQIQKVRENPFVPEIFNKRIKGMGVGESLNDSDAVLAHGVWLDAAAAACMAAEDLCELDCDKSRINRLLEPFLWHSAVISATEWDNFFALRDHPAAQPEFRILAKLMRKAMDESEPLVINYGEWHLPGTPDFPMNEVSPDWEMWKRVSAGRLARMTSYNLMSEDPVENALERAEKLIQSFHMSPTEHQATPIPGRDVGLLGETTVLGQPYFIGNFRGWKQFRKEIPNEHNAALTSDLK